MDYIDEAIQKHYKPGRGIRAKKDRENAWSTISDGRKQNKKGWA